MTLQWGRAFVGAEIGSAAADLVAATIASMGPRLCGRGDIGKAYDVQRNGGASMGPRLCGRGDGLTGPTRGTGLPSLQWGRAFVGAEIP